MAASPSEIRRGPGRTRGAALQPGGPRKSRPAKPKLPWWRQLYKDWGPTAGLFAAASAIVVGISGRDERRLFADEGLGYALGILGTLLILFLLLYPLRKRFRWLKILGNVRNWFRVHMILGVVGPLTILYHSNFSLGSANSTAALFAMLGVAGSGLVGRFLYAKVHHGLYGRKASLKELLASVRLTPAEAGGAAQFVPDLMQQIGEFDRQVLQPPSGVGEAMILPMRLMFQTRRGYRRIVRFVGARLDEQAVSSPVVAAHKDRLHKACAAFVREHLRRVRRVAAFAAYERLFSLWHKVHLPFFYIMLFTVIVHVIAVHVYAV